MVPFYSDIRELDSEFKSLERLQFETGKRIGLQHSTNPNYASELNNLKSKIKDLRKEYESKRNYYELRGGLAMALGLGYSFLFDRQTEIPLGMIIVIAAPIIFAYPVFHIMGRVNTLKGYEKDLEDYIQKI